jgi:hypothetical protein
MRYLIVLSLFGLVAAPVLADWPHQVKWDQLFPDPTTNSAASWIDYDTPSDALSADDYLCNGLPDSRFITDLEFWGFSYYGTSYLNQFRVQFYTDVPGTPNDASHPGTMLYTYDVSPANLADPLKLGWYEAEVASNGLSRFKIDLPEQYWFDQGLGEKILWVSIQGIMATDGYFDAFYWTFKDPAYGTWGDDAAFTSTYFGYPPYAHWGADPNGTTDLYTGPLPAGWSSRDLAFRLTGIPEPASLLLIGLAGMLIRRR